MALAAREAAGDEVDLIFELHRKLDPTKAMVVCNALAEYQPLFIEDPIQIDSIETQAELAKQIDAPIAMGERLNSIWEFEELLSHHVPIIVRPDVGLAGGLSGCRKIAAIAEAHHCMVAPHNFLGPGLTAPTLQLCATIPNLLTMEFMPSDEDASSAAFTTTMKRTGGYCEVPESPGLGVSLADDYASSPRRWRDPCRASGYFGRMARSRRPGKASGRLVRAEPGGKAAAGRRDRVGRRAG